jgi:lysophospholipase L1-like esterase
MRSVLCYGDSNTFGRSTGNDPDGRYGYRERWPGILDRILGSDWRIIEEGLGGRTTVSDDDIEGASRNGRTYLEPCLLSHRPLDLIIIMLGTNDLKVRFDKTASEICLGVKTLVDDIIDLGPGPKQSVPQIMIVAPPPILEDLKEWSVMFEGGREKSLELAEHYAQLAKTMDLHFVDAGSVVASSEADGFHLDKPAHAQLATAIGEAIEAIGWA